MLVLDINDVEITVSRDGAVLYREPGVALADRDGATFGFAALAKSRTRPRQSHNEFWQRLNGDPVKPQGRGVANQADLVYLHLQAIRAAAGIDQDEPAVVAAPSLVSAPQPALYASAAGIQFCKREGVVQSYYAHELRSQTGNQTGGLLARLRVMWRAFQQLPEESKRESLLFIWTLLKKRPDHFPNSLHTVFVGVHLYRFIF